MIDSGNAQCNAQPKGCPIFRRVGAVGIILLFGGYGLLFFLSRLPTLEARLPPEAQPRVIRRIDLLVQILLLPDQWLGEAWFGRPAQFGLWDRAPVLWWAGLVFLAAWAAGWLALRWLGVEKGFSPVEKHGFALAVGANLVSTYTLAVGWAGLLGYRAVFWIPLGLLLGAVGWIRKKYLKSTISSFYLKLLNYLNCLHSKDAPDSRSPNLKSPKRTPEGPPTKKSRPQPTPPSGAKTREAVGSWLVLPFAGIILLGAILPPVDFDVREYHLQAPKEWYLQGRLSFLPHNVYANMPLGAEMLALAAMGLSSDWWIGALAGKTMMACLTLVCAAGLWAIGRRMFSAQAGVVAALMYLATPWIVQVSTAGLNEGVTACYVLLSMWALWCWAWPNQPGDLRLSDAGAPSGVGGGFVAGAPSSSRAAGADWLPLPADQLSLGTTVPEPAGAHWPPPTTNSAAEATEKTPSGPSHPRPSGTPIPPRPSENQAWTYLVLGGYLVGAAAGTKYPALVFVALPALGWVVWRAFRTSGTRGLRQVGVFILAVVLGGGLWYGKNAYLAGNPVYPLGYSLLGGRSWNSEKEARWNRVHLPRQMSLARWADDLSRLAWRSEWIGPLIVPLALLSLLAWPRRWAPAGPGQRGGSAGRAEKTLPDPQEKADFRGFSSRAAEGGPISGVSATEGFCRQTASPERYFQSLLWGYLVYWIGMWWLLTHRIDRFWLPVLPMAALAAGRGFCWSSDPVWRRVRWAILLVGLGYGFLLASGAPAAGGYNRYFVPLERLRTDPERVDPWHLRLNQLWQAEGWKEGQVLLVGDAEPFDLEMPVLYATCFNTSPLEEMLWEAARQIGSPALGRWSAGEEESWEFQAIARGRLPADWLGQEFAEALGRLLAERKVEYIFVHWGEIARYRSPGNYGFTPLVQPELFDAWVRWGLLEPLPPLEGHPGRCYRVQR